MTTTIIALDGGKYGYQQIEPDDSRPLARCWIWPLVNCRIEGMGGARFDEAIGRAATCNGGHVSCYLGNGIYFRADMPQLGQTHALSITETPIAPPKVRRGIETRWHRQRWEKLLRTGWVPA